MLVENLKPTSISGIKSLAKRIKKRDGIRHAAALEAAAMQAGFRSYQEALDTLTEIDSVPEEVLPGGALADLLHGEGK